MVMFNRVCKLKIVGSCYVYCVEVNIVDPTGISYVQLIEEISGHLLDEKVVAMATDTVFGLIASAKSCVALSAIAALKGRPKSVSMPVIIGNLSQFGDLYRYGLEKLDVGEDVISRFWPGPLTLVVELNQQVLCDEFFEAGTVGIRYPDDVRLRDIATRVGPVVATSANKHGVPTPNNGKDVLEQLGRESFSHGLAMVLDETSRSNVASTVIDLSGPENVILREGEIPTSILRGAFRINAR